MGKEQISKEMDIDDDMSDNEEMVKEVQSEDNQFVLNPPTKYAYGKVDQKVALPPVSKSNSTMEASEISGCVISLVGTEPPCSSHFSMYDNGSTVKELTAEDFCTRDRYPSTGGFGSNQFRTGSRLPQEKHWTKLNLGGDSAKPSDMQGLQHFSSKVADNNYNAYPQSMSHCGEKHMPRNRPPLAMTQIKTTPPSSFSQFLLTKATKGKRIADGEPDACSGFDGLVMGQNNGKTCNQNEAKRTASNLLSEENASNIQLLSHISDLSHARSPGDGISLRQWLKPWHCTASKLEKLQLFGKIVELVDFAHSQGVILQDLQPSCFMLLPSNRIKYVGSSATNKMEPVVLKKLHENRPLEQVSAAFSRKGAKQQKVDADMMSFRSSHQFSSSCAFKSNSVNRVDRHETAEQNSENMGQNNCSYQTSSVAYQWKSVSPYIHLEEKWYASPEELDNGVCSLSSNIYNLGVLLFEVTVFLN